MSKQKEETQSQMSFDKYGRMVAQVGEGPGNFSKYSVGAFSKAFGTKLKANNVLVGFSNEANGLKDCALFSAAYGKNSRFIEHPVPLPYVSYIVSARTAFQFERAIYLKYLDQQHCEIICLDGFGCKMSAQDLQEIKYSVEKDSKEDPKGKEMQLKIQADVLEQMDKAYVEAIMSSVYPSGQDLIECSDLTFLHSALNGCTNRVFRRCLNDIGFKNFHFVDEAITDAATDLLTPEHMNWVIGQVGQRNVNIIFAHNSDGTKVAVLEKNPQTNTHEVISAPDVSLLLIWWSLLVYRFQKEYQRLRKQRQGRLQREYDMPPVFLISKDSKSTQIMEIVKKKESIDLSSLTNASEISRKVSEYVSKRIESEPKGAVGGAVGGAGPSDPAEADKGGDKTVPVLLALGEDDQYMCDPEFLTTWDGIGAAIHLAEMAIYLRGTYRTTLRTHLGAIKNKYQIQ